MCEQLAQSRYVRLSGRDLNLRPLAVASPRGSRVVMNIHWGSHANHMGKLEYSHGMSHGVAKTGNSRLEIF